jgi:hypothetical protein
MADDRGAAGDGNGGGWQEILDGLKQAAGNLMTLEITTTVVGDEPRKITTKIDLLQGDISNSLDEAFLKEAELQPIREFHAGQVEKGQAIVKGNVEVIVDLVKQLRDLG